MKHTASAHTTKLPVIVGRAPNARTVEGRQRQTLHRLKDRLGYSEVVYRNLLFIYTDKRYARDMNTDELALVIREFYRFLSERNYAAPVSDAEAADVLGLVA